MKVLAILAEAYAGTAVLSCVVLNVAMLFYARKLPIRERIADAGWILQISAVWPWTVFKGYLNAAKYLRRNKQ